MFSDILSSIYLHTLGHPSANWIIPKIYSFFSSICRDKAYVNVHQKYFEIEYPIGDTVYRMLQARTRTPKKIYRATVLRDDDIKFAEDITSEVVAFAGPNEDFHRTMWLTPSLLYKIATDSEDEQAISINVQLFNGKKITIAPNESIVLRFSELTSRQKTS
jgi:hypothetical protein